MRSQEHRFLIIFPELSAIALVIMVLGILTAIAACPAIIGTTEAVRQGQRQSAREKHRGLKTNLAVACPRESQAGREIDGCTIVLSEDKVRESLHPRRSLSAYPYLPTADEVKQAISQRTVRRISRWPSRGPSICRLFPALP
jgi:hypothetical protein